MRGNSFPVNNVDPMKEHLESENSRWKIYELNIKPNKCPHIIVKMVDSEIKALLDSGAEISVTNSIDMVHKYNFKVHKTNIKIDTAGTAEHNCLGFINAPLTFNNITKVIRLYIVLEFSKPLILGVNFWNAFNIIPAIELHNNELKALNRISSETYGQINQISLVEDYFSAEDFEITLKFSEFVGTVDKLQENSEEEDLSLEVPTLDFPPMSIDEIETEHVLNQKERCLLLDAISCFQFSEDDKIGRTAVLEHKIQIVPEAELKASPMYRCSPYVQKFVDEEIERMKKMDIIEPCDSDYASPLLPVKKSNGKFRVCLDSRRVNDVTKNNAYPIPNLHEVLHRIKRPNTSVLLT